MYHPWSSLTDGGLYDLQESILGPLLFILYINDLHMAGDKFKAILYADDTTLVSTMSAYKQNAGAPDYLVKILILNQ